MPASCVFCQIARGEVPSHVVHRDEDVIAFLDRAPLALGHVLVMPTAHVETLDDLPDALLVPVFDAVRRTSIAVQKALRAEGFSPWLDKDKFLSCVEHRTAGSDQRPANT